MIHILWKLTQKASFGSLRISRRSALSDDEIFTRKGQSRHVEVPSPLGKKRVPWTRCCRKSTCSCRAGRCSWCRCKRRWCRPFWKMFGWVGKKGDVFWWTVVDVGDLLQVSVSAKGKTIFIPLLTLAERSPLQSSTSTSTSGLGKNEIGCMGDCISKRKSPSQYPYSGLGLAHSTCLDLHVTGVAVFGPTGRYPKAPAIARTSQSAEFCSRRRIRWCGPDANRTLVLSGSHKFSSKPVSSLAVEVLHVLPSAAVVYALKRATAICFSAVI